MSAAALMVAYPVGEGATFDRGYYVLTHLPLVRRAFGPHGLTDATGYFPEGGENAPLAVAILAFRDADARAAALGSAEAGPVFDDIPNFTNSTPVATPLTVG